MARDDIKQVNDTDAQSKFIEEIDPDLLSEEVFAEWEERDAEIRRLSAQVNTPETMSDQSSEK